MHPADGAGRLPHGRSLVVLLVGGGSRRLPDSSERRFLFCEMAGRPADCAVATGVCRLGAMYLVGCWWGRR